MKLSQIIHSAFFILTVISVGIVSLLYKPFNNPVDNQALLNGERARALESQYDEGLFIKEFSINLWAAIEYRLFNEGKKGLVIGKDGWLFTEEEFSITSESEDAFEKNIELIKWVNKQFLKQNVKLVVVPVPAKARIYNNKLKQVKPEPLHQQSYDTFLSSLKQSAVLITDTLTAMLGAKSKQAQFLRTDTHWTPAGAETVATVAVEHITNVIDVDVNDKNYVTELKGRQSYKGDLFNYLPLSPWFDNLLPDADELALYETYESSDDSLDDLFGETAQTVALVGTSYSANPNWNFVGALKQKLASDILNYAQEGQGPIHPMMKFLETYQTDMPELQLVIWEIPVRYLTVSYQESYAKRESIEARSNLIAKEFKQQPLNL